jgi:hypothetical protein
MGAEQAFGLQEFIPDGGFTDIKHKASRTTWALRGAWLRPSEWRPWRARGG